MKHRENKLMEPYESIAWLIAEKYIHRFAESVNETKNKK